jgi:hypothetical protein
MKSLNEWRTKKSTHDVEWENLKFVWGSGTVPIDPKIKSFVKPRVGKIQDAIVASLGDPKIKSFRDVPPDLRDQFAQAVVAATLELFFGAFDPHAAGTGSSFNQRTLGQFVDKQTQPTQPKMPQDQTATVSKGTA